MTEYLSWRFFYCFDKWANQMPIKMFDEVSFAHFFTLVVIKIYKSEKATD